MSEQGESAVAKTVKRVRGYRYSLVLEGIAVGAIAGLVAVLFRLAIQGADGLRGQAIAFCRERGGWAVALWFLALAGAAGLVTLLLRWEPYISGSGIPQVEGEMVGQVHQRWWRVLLCKFAGGLLSLGAGLSLGREGPSIQLGAMAGKGFSRLTARIRTEEKLLMTCGASAGLAAAFNAPFAGVLFSLEEVHKNFSLDVLLPAMSASITADFLSKNIFGLKPVFDLSVRQMLPIRHYWAVALLGVALGLLGVLYNRCTSLAQDLYAHIRPAYLRTLIPFLLAGVLAFVAPQLLGGGHALVEGIDPTATLGAVALLFGCKFLFSMASFGAGVPGGIFLPLLVLGSLVGAGFFAGLAPSLGPAPEMVDNFVILGMAGYFAAIVRAPVTGILLISEMTGSFTHMLTLSLVSLVAYATADLLGCKPVYDELLERLLKGRGRPLEPTGEKVLVEAPVCMGSPACGRTLSQIDWPAGSLVVSVRRGERELVPGGATLLLQGDQLSLLCDESDIPAVREAMARWCETAVREHRSPARQ